MAEFLVQRLHRALRIGPHLRAVHQNEGGQRALLQQGSLDSACALYCLVMALTLLGHLEYTGTRRIFTSRRRILRRLAMQSPEVFFNGMTDDDFEELVADAGFRIYVDRVNGVSNRCLAHTVRALNEGKLSILSFSSRGEGFVHATLAVGIEGRQRARNFDAETLLCLDPYAPAWPYCGYNARLALNVPRPRNQYLRYSSASTPRLSVNVWSSIVLWSK